MRVTSFLLFAALILAGIFSAFCSISVLDCILLLIALAGVTTAIACMDEGQGRITIELTGILSLIALIWQVCLVQWGFQTWRSFLFRIITGGWTAAFPFWLLHILSGGRWIGGGDVCFMWAAGLWLGGMNAIRAMCLGCFLVLLRIPFRYSYWRQEEHLIPLGPELVVGCWLVFCRYDLYLLIKMITSV